MRTSSAILALATLLAVSLTDPASADAGDPPGLLFQRNGSDRTEVALVRRDGSGEVAPLASLPGGDQTNPDWSPSGRRFTFAMTDDHGTDDLWVARATGTRARKLVDCVAPCLYIDDPAWSPDGHRIVFSRTVERHGVGVGTLETVDVATGRTRVLLGPWTLEFTAGARWSPNGAEVVFEKVQKVELGPDSDISGVTLSVLTLSSGRVRALTDPALFAATADWSPQGRWIVYSALGSASGEAPDLFRIRPRGGEPVRITSLADVGGYAAEPTYTPGGQMIIFSGGRTDSEWLLLLEVRPDGTRLDLATGDVEIAGRHPRVRADRSRSKSKESYSSRCHTSPGTPAVGGSVVDSKRSRNVSPSRA